MNVIQVAGTNGKGSVSTYIAAILNEAGVKTGLFTSPHLVRETERIRYLGEEIPAPVLFALMRAYQGDRPLFLRYTNVCMEYFRSVGAQAAVLETGLGGRLDPTTRCGAKTVVLTRIGLDHMALLGDTIEQIAREKAAIIPENGICVTQPQREEAMQIIRAFCKDRNAALFVAPETGPDYSLKNLCASSPENARTAALAVQASGYRIPDKTIRTALEKAVVPARGQYFANEDLLLDGAHNEDAFLDLEHTLQLHFPGRPIVLLTASMRDKAVGALREVSARNGFYVVATSLGTERCRGARELQLALGAEAAIEDLNEAYLFAQKEAKKRAALLVAAGSFYLAGAILTLLQQ